MNNRILVFRMGAFGDTLITTPVIHTLFNMGYKITYVCNERGIQVLKNNPYIEKIIEQKTDSVPINQLADHIEWLRKKNHCDRIVDFSESIEVSLSQHPRGPNYKLPKAERFARFNRNFYEFSFEWATSKLDGMKIESESYIPELFFDNGEIDRAKGYLQPEKYNVLFGMSGSGHNKCWPYSKTLSEQIVEQFPDVHIITVGDDRCQLIEPQVEGRITNLSGKCSMRESMALTSLVDLVISPDTGLLHASGCYDTPKIALLGHNTHECISKHFKNAYPIESNPNLAQCSPCFFLIYDMKNQCPIDTERGNYDVPSHGAMCMSRGIPQDVVFRKFQEIYAESKKRG